MESQTPSVAPLSRFEPPTLEGGRSQPHSLNEAQKAHDQAAAAFQFSRTGTVELHTVSRTVRRGPQTDSGNIEGAPQAQWVRSVPAATKHQTRSRPLHTTAFEQRREAFRAVNLTPTAGGLLRRIRHTLARLFHFFYRTLCGNRLGWQTAMAAEHMTQGKLGGNLDEYATQKSIELLQKMVPPPEALIRALKYANALQAKEGFIPGAVLAPFVKRDIRAMDVNQQLAIPVTTPGHAMMMLITCTGHDSHGKKQYTIVHHNTGYGVEAYHYKRSLHGREKFQTGLVINDVSEDALCGPRSSFFSNVLALSPPSSKKLYEQIIPSLKGTIAPPSDNPRDWSHGQIGGSCTTFCGLSLIRSQLSHERYTEFREMGRLEMVLKSVRQIKSGWYSLTEQKIVTMEAVKKLEHSYERRHLEVPQELKETKRQLEEFLSPGVRKAAKLESGLFGLGRGRRKLNGVAFDAVEESGHMTPKDTVDMVNMAFSLVRDGESSQASLDLAYGYFEKATHQFFKLLIQGKPYSSEEHAKWEGLALAMAQLQNHPLSADQMYFMAALCALVKLNMGDAKSPNAQRKFTKFYHQILSRVRALYPQAYTKRTYCDLVLTKSPFTEENRISTPDGMKRMKATMLLAH